MWPSLLKIQYTELKLSCANDPVINMLFIVTVTLTFDQNATFNKISVISWRSVLLVEENGVNIIYSFRTITLVLYIGSLTNLAT
jgi:hypothetical protein